MFRKTSVALTILLVLIIALLMVSPSFLYTVDQREMAVVLQFGNPVAERIEPGLYFKWPLIQEVRKLPSTKQFWGDTSSQRLPDLPTKDDKKIEVIPWAIWKVEKPTQFVQRLVTMEEGERRISEFVRSAIRDVVTQYPLAELVRSTDRELKTYQSTLREADNEFNIPQVEPQIASIQFGRTKILDEIKAEAQKRLRGDSELGGRGIILIDVGISDIDFVESVRVKTFDRWIAERQSIAALNVNEGEKLKSEIVAQAEQEVESIVGEGQQKSNEIRGEVDAEVISKYAKAIETTGEFYTFVRTLEAYTTSIDTNTRLILTTDSDFLKLLKTLEPAPEIAKPAPTTAPLLPLSPPAS
ncbi:MAG: membrane protease subunit HflC [Pirellulaceae bacterium]|jgi:membrane protease subunit HflC